MIETIQRNGKIVFKIDEDKCSVNIIKKGAANIKYEVKQTNYMYGLIKEYLPLEVCTDKPLMLEESQQTKKKNTQ